MTDCLFCKIIAGEIPSAKVYEDDNVFAFLDIHPINIGHTLVIPKTHSTNVYETPDETLAHIMTAVKRLSIVVKKATNAEGINIGINNDSAAGQLIFHTHVHVIPRFSDDEFKHWHGAREYSDGEMEEVSKEIEYVLKSEI